MPGCQQSARCSRGRYVESNAWKGLRDTGRMQLAEFATPLPLLQGITRLLAGITGLGQGACPCDPAAHVCMSTDLPAAHVTGMLVVVSQVGISALVG